MILTIHSKAEEPQYTTTAPTTYRLELVALGNYAEIALLERFLATFETYTEEKT